MPLTRGVTCAGESAARTVRAALNQFETRCRTQAPAQIMVFRFVDNVERVGLVAGGRGSGGWVGRQGARGAVPRLGGRALLP